MQQQQPQQQAWQVIWQQFVIREKPTPESRRWQWGDWGAMGLTEGEGEENQKQPLSCD